MCIVYRERAEIRRRVSKMLGMLHARIVRNLTPPVSPVSCAFERVLLSGACAVPGVSVRGIVDISCSLVHLRRVLSIQWRGKTNH